MKIIKYKFLSCEINHGTEEEPDVKQVFLDKVIRCAEEDLEANEEIAKREAYNGQYDIEDDGQPATAAADDVLNALLGVTV